MTTPTRRPADEVRRLGEEIYERDIGPRYESIRLGEIAAIDVDSGDYAIADSVIAASERLRAQRPDADIWLVRIGYRSMSSFGGRPMRRRSE